MTVWLELALNKLSGFNWLELTGEDSTLVLLSGRIYASNKVTGPSYNTGEAELGSESLMDIYEWIKMKRKNNKNILRHKKDSKDNVT